MPITSLGERALQPTSGLRYSWYWYCRMPVIALFMAVTSPSLSCRCSCGCAAAACCRCRSSASRCRSAAGRQGQWLTSNAQLFIHPLVLNQALLSPAALTPASPAAAAAPGGGFDAAAAARATPFCTAAFDPPPPIIIDCLQLMLSCAVRSRETKCAVQFFVVVQRRQASGWLNFDR